MNGAIDFLADHGVMLLLGSTLLLAAGAIAIACRRAPVERQRLAELALVGVFAWSVLAIVPLPRFHRATQTVAPRTNLTLFGDRLVDQRRRIAGRKPTPLRADGKATATQKARLKVHSIVPSPAPAAANVDWRRIVAIAYLSGAAIMAAWLAVSRALLCVVVLHARSPEAWLTAILAIINDPSAGRSILRISARCGWPFSFGLVRPVIVLPSSLCQPERADTVRHVLLHELSHVRQHDAWGHLLANLGLPWLYFHPLYWWLRAAAQNAREAIADDWAARHSSSETYAAHLIGLAREAASRSPRYWVALAAIGSSSQFYRRMTMLLARENPVATRCSRRWRVASLVCAALSVGGGAFWIGIEPIAAQVGTQTQEVEIHIDKSKSSVKTARSGNDKDNRATSQVRFLGPAGMRGQWATGTRGDRHAYDFTLPNQGLKKFHQGSVYRLKLTDLPDRAGVELYPTLEIARSVPASEAFLEHSAIPLHFTEEDFDQALSGNLVTKVVYLPRPDQQERAIGGVETLVSTRIEPGVDPVGEAERKGTILAVLRMGDAAAPLGEVVAGKTATESPQAATGVHQPAAAVGVENAEAAEADDAPSRRPARIRLTASQLDLVEWIGAYSNAVRDAEIIGYDLEQHSEAEKLTPGVTPASQLRRWKVEKKAAERKVSLLLKLLKGAITAAKAEVDAAKRELAALEKAEKNAAVANRRVREARRRYENAVAEVETLESVLSEAASD